MTGQGIGPAVQQPPARALPPAELIEDLDGGALDPYDAWIMKNCL
jgi:hypothetical protein